MKMVKSLLLGSAAGLVAVAGAQAADLPVKAKPVEYVKICSLYGDGFFYIPGTDTCLRIGASVQADYFYNTRGNGHPDYDATEGAQDRSGIGAGNSGPHSTRGRADIGFDARTQTAFGTLRAVIQHRLDNVDQGTVSPNTQRAYIQWAGFTFGHTKGYTDGYGNWGGGADFRMLHQTQIHSDSGANGTNQIAYTWELGNGMVLVVGADERRVSSLTNLSNTNQVSVGANPTSSRGQYNHPNPYVAFRASQAWGNFSLSAIFNENNAVNYTSGGTGTAAGTGTVPGTVPCAPTAQSGTSQCNYPADKWGWAILTGIEVKAPFIAAGDRFGAFINYGVGASSYSGGSNQASPGLFASNNNVAVGTKTDGVYLNGGQIELTTTWTVAGSFEHYWMSNFSTTVFVGRTSVEYNSTVINGNWFCGDQARGIANGAAAQRLRLVSTTAACDPGYKFWEIGAHTDWYPVPGFRLGVEVAYFLTESGYNGQAINLTQAQGLRPTGIYTAKDQGIATVSFRAQRGFGGVGE